MKVLIYAVIFAALLLLAAPLAARVTRVLREPAPWTGGPDYMTTKQARQLLKLTAIEPTTYRIPGATVDDLGALPRARRRPFDRCWPGTDEPKRGC